MADMPSLFQRVQQGFEGIAGGGDSATYGKLAHAMSYLKESLREHIQSKTSADIEAIIGKLRSDKAIAPEEMQIVKLWIVGAAESYVTHENNFNDWIAELKRISGEFKRLDAAKLEVAQAFYAQALLMDAIRVAWDVHHYLEQQERLGKFMESTKELDAEERKLLADILARKLASPDF